MAHLTAALAAGGEALSPAAAAAICGVIRSVTTADDPRPPASKAFMHARLLAKNEQVHLVLLGALRGPLGGNAAAAGPLLVALRQVRGVGGEGGGDGQGMATPPAHRAIMNRSLPWCCSTRIALHLPHGPPPTQAHTRPTLLPPFIQTPTQPAIQPHTLH